MLSLVYGPGVGDAAISLGASRLGLMYTTAHNQSFLWCGGLFGSGRVRRTPFSLLSCGLPPGLGEFFGERGVLAFKLANLAQQPVVFVHQAHVVDAQRYGLVRIFDGRLRFLAP